MIAVVLFLIVEVVVVGSAGDIVSMVRSRLEHREDIEAEIRADNRFG